MTQTIITFVIILGACFCAGFKFYRYAISRKTTLSQNCKDDNSVSGCAQCNAGNCNYKKMSLRCNADDKK